MFFLFLFFLYDFRVLFRFFLYIRLHPMGVVVVVVVLAGFSRFLPHDFLFRAIESGMF